MFCRKPTPQDFARVAGQLAKPGYRGGLRRMRTAFFRTRVVSEEQFQAMTRMLDLFAGLVTEHASQLTLRSYDDDPSCVARAKKFVQAHAQDELSLKQVAQHVHLSPHHFCRIFKKAAGMGFAEYLSRVRVERAKALLLDPFARISEVAFAAGYGSIPQFNTVFRRYVGKSPTEYRATLPQQFRV